MKRTSRNNRRNFLNEAETGFNPKFGRPGLVRLGTVI